MEEMIYLRAQERASSFLHFPFHPPISQTMLLPRESAFVVTLELCPPGMLMGGWPLPQPTLSKK